jgi:hypothetical protein
MDTIHLLVKHPPTKSTHQSALRVMRRRGGGFFVGKYEKSEIKQWTNTFAALIRGKKPAEPWDCPVHIEIRFYFPWPESTSQKKKESAAWKTTRPDLDNSEKTILDTLTKEGFLKDDSFICSKSSFKWYHPEPRIEIILKKLT